VVSNLSLFSGGPQFKSCSCPSLGLVIFFLERVPKFSIILDIFFRVSMGILSRKIESWSFSSSLLITSILLLLVLFCNYIIVIVKTEEISPRCTFPYSSSKLCPSVLETLGLHVPTRHLRDFPLFYVCPEIKNRPSARYASAANVACRDFHIFRRQNVSLEYILL
jgi:hypothetical protein